jgi:hypothetical protein
VAAEFVGVVVDVEQRQQPGQLEDAADAVVLGDADEMQLGVDALGVVVRSQDQAIPAEARKRTWARSSTRWSGPALVC